MLPVKAIYFIFGIFLLLVLVTRTAGECTCDSSDLPGASADPRMLKFKLGALGAILGSGAVGVALPLVGAHQVVALNPDKSDIFFFVKAFAAGVILATGFIHILPDAFESLNSPCLPKNGPWGRFPFAGFIAMISSMGSLIFESLASGHSRRVHFQKNKNKNNNNIIKDGNKVVNEERGEEHAGHVHFHTHTSSHGQLSLVVPNGEESVKELSNLELNKHRITAKVLELGIVVHSVIIGISLGTTQSVDTIKPLMSALCFHQFFEGLGLGGCISQAKFKTRAMAIMAVFFSMTTPIGVAIGLAISGGYNENDPKSLAIQGIFEAAAAGILIYMALVDLLAVDFMNPRLQASVRIQLGSHVSLLLGAGCMSLLAKWA